MSEVFITYSHDSRRHKDWVLTFARALQNQNVKVNLDQLIPSDEAGDIPLWCEKQLRPQPSKFVLIVCTQEYRARFNREQGPNGSAFEAHLIYQYINKHGSKDIARYIVIIPPGGSMEDVPILINGCYKYQPTTFGSEDQAFQDLLVRLGATNLPLPTPTIPPNPPGRERPTDASWSEETQREINRQLIGIKHTLQDRLSGNADRAAVEKVLGLLYRWTGVGDDSAAEYRKAVVEIARKVIELRSNPLVQMPSLPIPAYDLLLPFKARESAEAVSTRKS